MPKPFRQSLSSTDTDSEPVVYDDAGSGLLKACKDRFATSGCEVTCDARHTVWVKTADGARSVGLSPWMVNRHSVDELLDNVEEKLGLLSNAR